VLNHSAFRMELI